MPAPEPWPFKPLARQSSETLEWFTEVMPTYEDEQRLALRNAPRQTFSYTAKLDRDEYARAKVLATRLAGTVVGAPVWIEGVELGAVASSDDTFAFDTTAGDWRVGDYVMVWESNALYATGEVATLSDTELTLVDPIGETFTDATIVPLRRAYAVDGFRTARTALHADVSVKLQVLDNQDNGGAALASTYQSLDVLTDAPIILGDIAETIIQPAEFIDNGFGLVALEPITDYVRAGFTLSFMDETKAALWARRAWLHRCRGRQKPFWVPAFNQDFAITSSIGSGDTSVTVTEIGPASYFTDRHVMIELLDGTRFFRRITGASAGTGTTTLTLSSSLGQAVTAAQIRRFCFLHKVRLDSDRVTIAYRYAATTAITVPVVEVTDA